MVSWEPYGGLRKYTYDVAGSGDWTVEYRLTDDSETLPSIACNASLGGTSPPDKSGRLRAVLVSRAWNTLSGTGDIIRQVYTWKGDQLEYRDSCVLTSAFSRVRYGYDNAGRLDSEIASMLTADAGSLPTENGRNYFRAYAKNKRDSRTATLFDINPDGGIACGIAHYSPGSSNQIDMSWIDANANCGDSNPRNYYPEVDGRIGIFTNGYGGWQADFNYTNNHGGLDTVFKQVTIQPYSGASGATWSYYYDAFGRRRFKLSPAAGEQEFFYDMGQTLLVDRIPDVDGPWISYQVADDYVWLGGRPIAFVRGKFTGWTRNTDSSSEQCNRMGVGSKCGLFHIVTDFQGKPIATLNEAGKVAGYVEYDAYGFTNRAYVAKTVTVPLNVPEVPILTTSEVGSGNESVASRVKVFKSNMAPSTSCSGNPILKTNGAISYVQNASAQEWWRWGDWIAGRRAVLAATAFCSGAAGTF